MAAAFALLLALLACELLLSVVAPRALGPFAFARVAASRSVALSPDAARALAPRDAAWSYRRVPDRRVDPARLPGPRIARRGAVEIRFSRDGARVVARARAWLPRVRPLLFVRVRGEDARIVLDARAYPAPLVAIVASVLLAGVACASCTVFWLGPLVALVPPMATRGAARALLDATEREIASRVDAIARGAGGTS